MVIRPLKDYYYVQILEPEQSGKLILQDKSNVCKAKVLAVPLYQSKRCELMVGDYVIIHRNCCVSFGEAKEEFLFIDKEFIIAEWKDK